MSEGAATSSTEERATGLWGQLPSFDPSVDDIREYTQKARFLHGVFPEKDRPNLAPRLAMMCKGTAWSQVRHLDPVKLTDATNGVAYLLEALSTWEENDSLKTFELFEKALYKVVQKADEATHSFSLRLNAAFEDLGEKVTVKEMQAFVMLRQSALSNDDKKKVLAMTNGEIKLKNVEQAMRTLSTKVLLSAGETKKKIYPTNFVESDEPQGQQDDETLMQSTYHVSAEEDDALSAEVLDHMASQGDEDALLVQQFERDLEDLFQDVPDLQTALVSYQEARQRINDRRRGRGFWPSKSRGKGFGSSSFGRGGRKGGHKGGKEELLSRIARTHCKLCGALGHWKAECPQRKDGAGVREQANVVHAVDVDEQQPSDLPQVIFETAENEEARDVRHEVCFVVHSVHKNTSESIRIPATARQHAISFLESRMNKYKMGNNLGHKNGAKSKQQSTNMHRKRAETLDRSKLCHPPAECLASRSIGPCVKTTGMAILDTGASRSVIGIEHVPSVLRKLPSSIREQVREVPSKIGFRFGNNQIEYSFKQMQIPLVHKNQRIWLLVEVVPKATPFLLSIKAMKSLGASIDLEKSTCYLKKLNKSLPLKENSNGLFVIDMSDLCSKSSEEPSAAFVVLEGLRVLSEEVMESLRVLFYMLFTLTKALQPNEEMPEQDVTPIQRLIHEVKCQRQKISELGELITKQNLGPQARSSGPTLESPMPSIVSDAWEMAEMEEEFGQSASAGVAPNTSRPVASTKVPMLNMKIAGIPVAHQPPKPSGPAQPPPATQTTGQIALTHQALESWGRKQVSWGRKHQGKNYEWVYNNDQGYIKWMLARMGNLGDDAEDFCNYSITRQRLESAAMNANPM
eukprot:s1270_g21.t1